MQNQNKKFRIKILLTEERYKIWIGLLYFIFLSLILITIGTIIQSIYVLTHLDTINPELKDPAIYWFPYIIYIPYTLFTLPLILTIINNLKLNNIERYNYLQESNKIMHKLTRKLSWNTELNSFQKVMKKITLIILCVISTISYLIGIPSGLIISPMNAFYQPFLLSFLMLWISIGLKKENRLAILWLAVLLVVAMSFLTIGLVIGEDFILLPVILGYQGLALLLMILNFFLLRKE